MRTSLYEEHRRSGAKITEFAGWEMPLYYSGIVQEVLAVRHSAGIFDLSHMGELIVAGDKALDFLQFLLTNDLSRIEIGQAQYTLMCDENGGIIDDLIVYHLAADEYMLVVNAANTASDFEWIQEHQRPGVRLENRSADIGLVAVQGPSSNDLLQRLVEFDLSTVSRFWVRQGRVGNIDSWVARTGYTGEDGFELYCSAPDSPALWQLLIEAGSAFRAVPAGLGARDILRIEVGYPLYGHELTRTRTPVDAGLLWVVEFAKASFLGKEGIMQRMEIGSDEVLTGLETVRRCVPRRGYDVVVGGLRVGQVTSGTFSPTLGKGIAMAYVEPQHARVGTKADVMVRGKSCPCRVVPMPFYRSAQPASTHRQEL